MERVRKGEPAVGGDTEERPARACPAGVVQGIPAQAAEAMLLLERNQRIEARLGGRPGRDRTHEVAYPARADDGGIGLDGPRRGEDDRDVGLWAVALGDGGEPEAAAGSGRAHGSGASRRHAGHGGRARGPNPRPRPGWSSTASAPARAASAHAICSVPGVIATPGAGMPERHRCRAIDEPDRPELYERLASQMKNRHHPFWGAVLRPPNWWRQETLFEPLRKSSDSPDFFQHQFSCDLG